MARFSRTAQSSNSCDQPQPQPKRRSIAAEFEPIAEESAKAFQAFTVYRDLPADERSLTTVSERLGKSKSLCARWSAQFRWVERAGSWDSHQDEIRRARMIAERDKIYERQLQHNRIASQALMAPLLALGKRSQTRADAFAEVSTAELTKVATFAARALPGIHQDERKLATAPNETAPKDDSALKITRCEFRWVQGQCTCGHTSDDHYEDPLTATGLTTGTRCTVSNCKCSGFVDADEDQ
jgi:hypothetical protein